MDDSSPLDPKIHDFREVGTDKAKAKQKAQKAKKTFDAGSANAAASLAAAYADWRNTYDASECWLLWLWVNMRFM